MMNKPSKKNSIAAQELLGVELLGLEEADDVSVVLSGPRKHERGSALRFQCLDVWD